MDRFIKVLLLCVPVLAMAGLVAYIMNPDLVNTGPRVTLNQKIQASQDDSACPDYASILNQTTTLGPHAEGIPAIVSPTYVSADEAGLEHDAQVLGLRLGDFVAAYPEDLMVWHEVVNDESEGLRFTVTYSPLTRSAIAFLGRWFTPTGQQYNANQIFSDQATGSKVPQILGIGVSGELCGLFLPTAPVRQCSWLDWKTRYPQTLVMSEDTGYKRNYGAEPYASYHAAQDHPFDLTIENPALPPKAMVFGIEYGGETAAIPVEGFATHHPMGLSIKLGGGIIVVWWDHDLKLIRTDEDVRQMQTYWFAWFAQHPATKIIE